MVALRSKVERLEREAARQMAKQGSAADDAAREQQSVEAWLFLLRDWPEELVETRRWARNEHGQLALTAPTADEIDAVRSECRGIYDRLAAGELPRESQAIIQLVPTAALSGVSKFMHNNGESTDRTEAIVVSLPYPDAPYDGTVR